MSRILHVLRHAEAARGAGGLSDHDRPLTPRGCRQADLVARLLGSLPVDHVWVSTARRTQTTIAPFLALRPDITPNLSATLYRTCAEGLIDLLMETPPSATACLVVGHNPTVSECVETLTGQPVGDLSPATLVTLEFQGPWDALDAGVAKLVRVELRAARLE